MDIGEALPCDLAAILAESARLLYVRIYDVSREAANEAPAGAAAGAAAGLLLHPVRGRGLLLRGGAAAATGTDEAKRAGGLRPANGTRGTGANVPKFPIIYINN